MNPSVHSGQVAIDTSPTRERGKATTWIKPKLRFASQIGLQARGNGEFATKRPLSDFAYESIHSITPADVFPRWRVGLMWTWAFGEKSGRRRGRQAVIRLPRMSSF